MVVSRIHGSDAFDWHTCGFDWHTFGRQHFVTAAHGLVFLELGSQWNYMLLLIRKLFKYSLMASPLGGFIDAEG